MALKLSLLQSEQDFLPYDPVMCLHLPYNTSIPRVSQLPENQMVPLTPSCDADLEVRLLYWEEKNHYFKKWLQPDPSLFKVRAMYLGDKLLLYSLKL